LLFVDHEIDNDVNGPYNEYGAYRDPALLAAGQHWEIDEPGWNEDPADPMGDIFKHATSVAGLKLDDSNGITITYPFNVSMAIGWIYNIPTGKHAIFQWDLSTTAPGASVFALEQHDTGTNSDVIYFSGSVTVKDIQYTGVPEPGGFVLLGAGFVGLLAARIRRGK